MKNHHLNLFFQIPKIKQKVNVNDKEIKRKMDVLVIKSPYIMIRGLLA